MMSKRTMMTGVVLASALAGLCSPPARAAAEPSAPSPAPPAVDHEVEGLSAMMLGGAPVPITPPAATRAAATAAKLPPDGSLVTGRIARLARDGDWSVLRFDAVKGGAKSAVRRVLPCRLLASMEKAAADDPAVRFRIWAENTTYRGKVYVLPTAVLAVPRDKPTTQSAPPKPPPAATRPASRPASADMDDIMRELLRKAPERPLVAPLDESAGAGGFVGEATSSVAPLPSLPPLPVGRGQILTDRLVRLTGHRDSQWKLVSFEADNTLRQPPIRLLPCKMLAAAEKLSRHSRTLRISGLITVYRGRRYLLPRKVLHQRELGRF